MIAPHRSAVWISLALLALGVLTGCQTRQGDQSRIAGLTNYVRGYDAYQTGDRDRAVDSLLAAVQENPKLITARGLLAEIYRREGNHEAAIEQYQTLTRLDPYYHENYYHLGVSQHLINRIRAAAESYQQALRLNPNDPKSNMNLGLAYMAMGDSQRALPYARKATELQPDSAAAWGNLALVLDSNEQYAEAEQVYRRSLELDSTVAGVRLNFANNLIRQDRPQEATAILERLVREHPTALAHRRLGDAYVALDKPDEARSQYEKALQLNNRYYPALNELATMKITEYDRGLQLNDALRQEAVSLWKRSLQANPRQPRVREALQRWDPSGA